MAFEPTGSDGYLKLWRLIFPESYTNPIEGEGDGDGEGREVQFHGLFFSEVDAGMCCP